MEEVDSEDIKTIYQLKLHETLETEMKWGLRYAITRVPDGWIYQGINRPYNGNDVYTSTTFVPYNKEYYKRNK